MSSLYDGALAGASPHRLKKRKLRMKIVLTVVIVVLVAGLATLVVMQWFKINSGDADWAAARSVQDEVAKIMIVPAEDALVSDVENADQIKGQPFFAEAQNGDKVLVFVGAAKIVIYRPSTRQVVNAGPIVDDRVDGGAE